MINACAAATALLLLAGPAAGGAVEPALRQAQGPAGAQGPGSMIGNGMCLAVRRQVLVWSRQAGSGKDRPHVVAIHRPRLVANRMRQSPSNGLLLSCAGRAKLSNGLQAPVAFGMTAVDGTWYLFLRKISRS